MTRRRLSWLGRLASAILLGAIALAPLAGCTRSATPISRRGRSASTTTGVTVAAVAWDREALAAALPCLLTISEGPSGLTALSLDGRLLAGALLSTDRHRVPQLSLLDASAEGPRVALSASTAHPVAVTAVSDTILLLDDDGSVVTASAPTPEFPLVSSAAFLEDGSMLWLRRLETEASIETSIGAFDIGSRTNRTAVLTGSWPTHRYVAGLVPLRKGNLVAVVLKTDGTPSLRDDFAVVAAHYRNGALEAVSGPFRDDMLFTLAPGATSGSLLFARATNQKASEADEIVGLALQDGAWRSAVLLRDADCDSGLDVQHVCSGGPDGSVLYRAATRSPSGARSSVSLRQLPIGAAAPRDTGAAFPPIGSQWFWIGARATR